MTEIAGYDNLEVIGRGGFAVVYRAQQKSVGRDVAIKLLSDPTPDDDLVRRFERESKAVGALSWHPHIAAVVDAGATDLGQAYIVFELISGGSLEDRIATGPMPWQEAIASMIQVADATEAAHRADVLHRDIKPANILMDRLGRAKLGDFGIASMQDGNKTETGMLATTVAHAAPELFDGQPSSAATDVYALGSTLHTLVTGAPPFAPPKGERIATTITRIANEPPPRPSPEQVPTQIADVIAHALAKQPQYRPRSAAAFGHALQTAQRALGLSVTAMPVADNEPSAEQRLEQPPVDEPPLAPSTEHVPFSPAITGADTDRSSNEKGRGPFARTIILLGAIAALLAAGLIAVLVFQAVRPPLATTAGGADIRSVSVVTETEMANFPKANAIDQDDSTYWGIEPDPESGRNIVGTTYVITLTGQQTVTSVGISNGDATDLGRVAQLRWAPTRQDLNANSAAAFTQNVADGPGPHLEGYRQTTDEIFVAITGVHDPDAPNAGVAEILVVVE